MLGRTHMGIGAVASVVATPLVLHQTWEPVRRLLSGHWNAVSHILVAQILFAAAAILGSIVPDLDQPDSLMAHKIVGVGKIVVVGMGVTGVILLHRETSVAAWGVVALLGLLFGAKKNVTRMLGLGVVGAGMLYLGWMHDIPLVAGAVLAIWTVGAILTAHRTFTHSLLGLALFATGVYLSADTLKALHVSTVAAGLMMGYALHLVADAVAGGVPLLWPWGKRQGIRLVQTGSPFDHMIGGFAILGFLALAIL